MNLNAAHLHIMLNHFPIVGVVVGTGLLTLWLLWRREGVLLAGLWTLVGSGLASIPVYILGNEAEDVIEGMKGISRASIERHQDAATWALVGLILLGLAAGWALWQQRRSPVTRAVVTWIWILSLVVSGIVTWASERGGEIHHPEIRPGWQRPPETGGEKPDGAALRWSPVPIRVAPAARA